MTASFLVTFLHCNGRCEGNYLIFSTIPAFYVVKGRCDLEIFLSKIPIEED